MTTQTPFDSARSKQEKVKAKRQKPPPGKPMPEWIKDLPPTQEYRLQEVYGTQQPDFRHWPMRVQCYGGCGKYLTGENYRIRYLLCDNCLRKPAQRYGSED